MRNDEIIAEIAVSLYGEDAVQEMVRQGKEIPLHSFSGWKSRGYTVKTGEHGVEAKLWKKRNPSDVGRDQFYLTKTFLFSGAQVEKAN